MKCPKCKDVNLKATKLDEGLPVMGCVQCEGAVLPLLYYRDWAERSVMKPEATDASAVNHSMGESIRSEAVDSKVALNCPKCSKIMSKYAVSGCSANRLDLCLSCDEAWLDGGEWELLKALELSKNMPIVFTEAWQRKIRKEKTESARLDRLAQSIGSDDIERVAEMRNWIAQHPRKKEIVHFLGLD